MKPLHDLTWSLPMKIRVWNVNKGFSKKAEPALFGDPDIAIFPESSRDVVLRDRQWFWVGENAKSGLGVAIRDSITVLDFQQVCDGEKWFSAVTLDLGTPLVVIAVWACYECSPRKGEKGPVSASLEDLIEWIGRRDAIVAGDFNNSRLWDKSGRSDNFESISERLGRAGLVSAYHDQKKENFGEERSPTFFSRRSRDFPYHIDYCFLPGGWTNRLAAVEVGGFDDWIGLSDHMPMTVEISESEVSPPTNPL